MRLAELSQSEFAQTYREWQSRKRAEKERTQKSLEAMR